MALEPFLVNLADSAGGEGGSYLRVVMVLRVTDAVAADPKKKAKPAEGKPGEDPARAVEAAELRDAALGVLASETPEELLTPAGKDALKRRLLGAFQKHDPQTKVQEVLFTEFLVQR